MNGVFKQPSAIPQDLLLIQDLVETLPPPSPRTTKTSELLDEDINSSGASDSEEEVLADLLVEADRPVDAVKPMVPVPDSDTDTDTDTDSSDDNETPGTRGKPPADADDDDDEDDDGPKRTVNYVATKNETEPAAVVPEIQSVGADEVLEHIGEIVNTMEQAVVVRGIPSEIAGRGSDKALDAGTLLVFEDRTVLGFIYDIFGPTSQPLYQIKFSTESPLQLERMHVARKIYHVPARSTYVFLNRIKHLKGSDASNVHDEEPDDDELEFSDDEAEAAHKSALKQKRRGTSARPPSSRGTPAPRSLDPYDEDYDAGPSRPAPMPYDDPYAEEYTPATQLRYDTPPPEGEPGPASFSGQEHMRGGSPGRQGQGRGPHSPRGRRGGPRDRGGGRGRERERGGRGRGRGDRGRGGRGRHDDHHQPSRSMDTGWNMSNFNSNADPESGNARGLSPTTMAIERATGQYGLGGGDGGAGGYYDDAGSYQQQQQGVGLGGGFGYPQQQGRFDFSYPMQYGQNHGAMQGQGQGYNQGPQDFNQGPGHVQPHINPRFASALGFDFGGQNGMQGQSQQNMQMFGAPYGMQMQNEFQQQQSGFQQQQQGGFQHGYGREYTPQYNPQAGGGWTDEWTVPTNGQPPQPPQDQNQGS